MTRLDENKWMLFAVLVFLGGLVLILGIPIAIAIGGAS
jgi:hypothetical protein